MIWPVRSIVYGHASRLGRSAYTLIEILVSTALTLMLLMAVVQIFGTVSEGIANSRSALEMADQLRAAQTTLQRDLEGVTVTMSPPRRPESGEGYFEYTEGPIGPAKPIEDVAENTDTPTGTPEPDSTVGDIDDMLLFTTRTRTTPFVGRGRDPTGTTMIPFESQEAEVAWFLRGRTLYRRVLLVLPNATWTGSETGFGFFDRYDISVRNCDDDDNYAASGGALAPNSLSDLTKPENRFAHRAPHLVATSTWRSRFPFHPHFYADFTSGTTPIVRSDWAGLGLPTLRECSHSNWLAGGRLPNINLGATGTFDAWLNPHPAAGQDRDTGALNDFLGDRIGEDVILTNVIGFDVKAWDPTAPVLLVSPGGSVPPYTLLPGDPGYIGKLRDYLNNPAGIVSIASRGAYVDLNYLCRIRDTDPRISGTPPAPATINAQLGNSAFGWAGDGRSRVRGTEPIATSPLADNQYRSAVYDTWSTHYECDGDDTDGDGTADQGTDGFDSVVDGSTNGVVDDPAEQEAPPPYPVPLRGIQVRIRVFEPASRQIREVTVVQDFLPK